MLNIRKERRHRMVVKLICEKLKIDDKELDAFIKKSQPKKKVVAPEEVVETKDKKK